MAYFHSPTTNPLFATTRRASDTLATSRAGTTAANAATYSATCTAPLRSPSTRTPTSTRAACPAVHVATVTRSSRNGAVWRMHNPPPASLPTEAAILTPPLHPSPRPLLLPASASRFPPRSPTVSQETGIGALSRVKAFQPNLLGANNGWASRCLILGHNIFLLITTTLASIFPASNNDLVFGRVTTGYDRAETVDRRLRRILEDPGREEDFA